MNCKHILIFHSHRCEKCPDYKTCTYELKGIYNVKPKKEKEDEKKQCV